MEQLNTTVAPDSPTPVSDSPEARRYNRIRRWLGIADAILTTDRCHLTTLAVYGVRVLGIDARIVSDPLRQLRVRGQVVLFDNGAGAGHR